MDHPFSQKRSGFPQQPVNQQALLMSPYLGPYFLHQPRMTFYEDELDSNTNIGTTLVGHRLLHIPPPKQAILRIVPFFALPPRNYYAENQQKRLVKIASRNNIPAFGCKQQLPQILVANQTLVPKTAVFKRTPKRLVKRNFRC